MPGNTGEIRRGASRPSHPPGIVAHVVDGSTHRGILQDGVPGIPGSDAGGPSVTHHVNVVVDTVVQQWVEVAVDIAGEKDRPGW